MDKHTMQRRRLLAGLVAGGTLGLTGCATMGSSASRAKVVVVGGGYGGSTVSKYIRVLSDGQIDVTMVEPNRAFVSCPVSNLVLSGMKTMDDITTPYTGLSGNHGVRIVHDMVTAVDPAKKTVKLAGGSELRYDKIVVAPGIDFMWERIEGLRAAHDSGQILHAWKAGPETLALRRQIEAMRDGGTVAITIPEAPYRCPPGPYERASVIAAYLKKAKPKSKVLILDANPDVTSKGKLFKDAWKDFYGPMLEYRGQHKLVAVDARTKTLKFDVQDDLRADVLNVLPVMRAGALVTQMGLTNANGRWCHVNFLNFESTAAKDVHIIGDSIQVAQGMPKSGHMANSHAKVTAAAIVAELQGLPVNPHPMLTNVCMSFVDDTHVIHVASVHEYETVKKSFFTIGGSGGVSDARSDLEGRYAEAWARNIWADMLS
jgi:NADPH-dependent 2,4-dienoyl-CoA reductase/sulfur reductase-like enzyme